MASGLEFFKDVIQQVYLAGSSDNVFVDGVVIAEKKRVIADFSHLHEPIHHSSIVLLLLSLFLAEMVLATFAAEQQVALLPRNAASFLHRFIQLLLPSRHATSDDMLDLVGQLILDVSLHPSQQKRSKHLQNFDH